MRYLSRTRNNSLLCQLVYNCILGSEVYDHIKLYLTGCWCDWHSGRKTYTKICKKCCRLYRYKFGYIQVKCTQLSTNNRSLTSSNNRTTNLIIVQFFFIFLMYDGSERRCPKLALPYLSFSICVLHGCVGWLKAILNTQVRDAYTMYICVYGIYRRIRVQNIVKELHCANLLSNCRQVQAIKQ